MIIVLNGADFSANNIGKVEIAVKISERTKAICAAYGKSFTTSQQVALQNLIDWLDDEGILSEMDALYLPCMASSLDKVLVNAAKAPYDVDFVPSSDYFALRSKGLYQFLSGAGSDSLKMECTKPANDSHILFYNTEEYNTGALSPSIYGENGDVNLNSSWNESSQLFVIASSQYKYGGYLLMGTSSSNAADNLGGFKKDCGLQGFNFKDITGLQEGLLAYNPAKTLRRYKAPVDWTGFTGPVGTFSPNYIGSKTTVPLGLISIGAGLTDEQVLKYDELARVLIESLN